MSRNLWIVLICLSIMGLVGLYADLFLSLEAYNTNPEIFIEYESNQEAVDWFVNGEFPFMFMLTVLTLPICIFCFLYFYEKHKTIKHAPLYFATIIFFIYFIFWTRLSAGLTWFLPIWYINKGFQSIAIALYVCLLFFIFYYFPRQTNSFPFKKGGWTNE